MKNYIKSPTAGSVIFAVLLTIIAISAVGEYVISRPVNGYLQVFAVLATLGLIGLTAKMVATLIQNFKEAPLPMKAFQESDIPVKEEPVAEKSTVVAEERNVVMDEPIQPAKPKRTYKKKTTAEKPVTAEAKPAAKKPRKPRVKKETEIKKEK